MSRPAISTGHEFSATELNDLWTQFGLATADVSVNNSTTLADATGLSVNLLANRYYRMDGEIYVQAPSANSSKFSAANTGTIDYIRWTLQGVPGGGTSGQWYSGIVNTVGFVFTVAGQGATNPQLVSMRGTLHTTASGIFKIQFAESVAGAGTAATVLKGSWIGIEVIG